MSTPFSADSNSDPHRELGFVLKSSPYQERDLILVLFTEKRGKISAIARNGIQSKRFGASLDLFLASEFELDPKSSHHAEHRDDFLIQLNSAQPRHSIRAITQHLEKLAVASCLNELLVKTLPPGRAALDMFKLYSNALLTIEERSPEQSVGVLNGFMLKLTQWLGVQPLLTRCQSCQRTLTEIEGDYVRPLLAQGSWVCQQCRSEGASALLSRQVLNDAVVAMIQPIKKLELTASMDDHFELLQYLEKHLAFCVPGFEKDELSSIRFLKSIRSLA